MNSIASTSTIMVYELDVNADRPTHGAGLVRIPAVRQRLDEAIEALVARGAGCGVEVDLRAVTLLGSSAMRWLLRLRDVVVDAGRELAVVVDEGDHPARVLDIIGLDDSLPVRRRPRLSGSPTRRKEVRTRRPATAPASPPHGVKRTVITSPSATR